MRKIINIVAFAVLLAGLILLGKPYARCFVREQKNDAEIREFDSIVDSVDPQSDDAQTIAQMYDDMKVYNETIALNGQSGLSSPGSAGYGSTVYIQEIFPSGMIGYLEIEKINVTIPIFYGINDDNLSRGAAVMEGTSFPVGGSRTNCVLAAHRLPGMLGDVEMLEQGDIITLKNFEETMRYRIVKSIVIEPFDTDKVKIISDRDMITLLTCHPYWVNSHRLIVYAERVEDESSATVDSVDATVEPKADVQSSGASAHAQSDTQSDSEHFVTEKITADSDLLQTYTTQLTPADLPQGEPFEPSAPTIKAEDTVRKILIAATLIFIVFLVFSLFRRSRPPRNDQRKPD